MKVSETWLREWVNPSISTEELAAQLTMAGLEVDSVAPVAGAFHGVVVARVLQTRPHPQADKLTLCQVDAGTGTLLHIVCGAANVRSGLTVALAMIGASLPNGMLIKEAKLRGELSQGMLCSAEELGMQDQAEGIIELPDDAPLGTDLRDFLKLDDQILDIDLTPNRADCFSVLGIAREIAAINQLPLAKPTYSSIESIHGNSRNVKLEATTACPRYLGRSIRSINPQATTPLWITERLRRAGIRPKHPVVDVTNYVMLELGQPMHAYNERAIDGDIHVRFSRAGETLILLNDQTVTLKENTLVIADHSKTLAIAGIMGGQSSAVQDDTVDIFLESAFFHPQHLAGVARSYGLCTDSSQRFERGVDFNLQQRALDRATELLIGIVGGQPGSVVNAQCDATVPTAVQLTFNPDLLKRLTGVSLDKAQMTSILQQLELTVNTQTTPWQIIVPSHRFDITLDVDCVEEIIRIYGYGNLNTQRLVGPIQKGFVPAQTVMTQNMSEFLCCRGYHEIISYSFVDPGMQEAISLQQDVMNLLNPISSELSQMRVNLWSGLLAALVYNSHRQQSLIKLFEVGVIFDHCSGSLIERPCLAGLIAGEFGGMNWSEPTRSLDFFDLKGDVQALLSRLNLNDVVFKAEQHPALHPGQSAKISLNGTPIGWIGVLHPRLCNALDIVQEVIVFDLMLDQIPLQSTVRFEKISKFPSIRRDLSFVIGDDVSSTQIEQAIRTLVDSHRLKSFDVFDVYAGQSIPAGKKSMAIALTLQDDDRTLIDEEVNELIDAIIKKLNNDFAITLRD